MTDEEIPAVQPAVVDAITAMLIEDQGILRPPEKAAALLAIICALHKRQMPFPRRQAVARAIGAGLSTVDAALSTRLNEGYIQLKVKTRPGNVRRRGSVVRERYYEPSPKLMSVFEEAKRRSNIRR